MSNRFSFPGAGSCAIAPAIPAIAFLVLASVSIAAAPASAATSHEAGAGGADGSATLTRPLSVQDAVRLALERNPSVEAARLRIEQARARLRKAASSRSPRASFDLGYLRGDAPSAFLFKNIDGHRLAPDANFNEPGLFQNFEAGVTLRYNIWDWGRSDAAIRTAMATMAGERSARRAVVNELIGAVIQAYFDILSAGEFVTVAEDSAATVAEQLRETRIRYANGSALEADVLSIEVREAEARERLISARNAEELARSALRRLLDFPPGETVELSGEEWHPAPLPETLEECLETARARRPEIKAMEARLAASRHMLDLARRVDRPSLDLVGRYYGDDASPGFRLDDANWTVGATLTWQFDDGGSGRHSRSEARAAVAEAEARLRSLTRSIEMQVHQAFIRLKEARERLRVAEANVDRAKKSLALVKSLFENGSATVTRYLQAETDRTDARFRAIAARYDVKKAGARLGHVLGLCLQCSGKWFEDEEPAGRD